MRRVALRALAAGAALFACAGDPTMSEPVAAATPSPIWRDAASLRVLCLAHTESGVDPRLQDRICARLRDLASSGAPIPVATMEIGDPAVLAPDTVTLLLHASVQRGPVGRLLTFSIRPFRNLADQANPLFAAAPRAVAMPSDDVGRELEEALNAALDETLPWRAASGGSRRIDP